MPLRVVVIVDDPATRRSIRTALGTDIPLRTLSFAEAATGPVHAPPQHLADAIEHADAVVIEWDTLRAHEIGPLCYRLRAPDTLLLAVADDPGDRIAALAVGADRFQPLPLSAHLLRAQVVAHRRHGLAAQDRRRSDRPAWARHQEIALGPLLLDWRRRTASVHDDTLPLTPRQFEVLACFAARPNEVLSRDRVPQDAWGFEFDTGTNVVDVYVHHLRRMLQDRGLPNSFQTVRGRGYRLTLADPTDSTAEA